MKHPRGYTVLVVVSVLWCAGILAPPLLRVFNMIPAGEVLVRALYKPVCHQDPLRTVTLGGSPLSVCIRCCALYFSAAAIILLAPFLRRIRPFSMSVAWLCAGLAPMALDVAFSVATPWHASTWSRLGTGAVAGITLAVFIVPAWESMWEQIVRYRTYTSSPSKE
jgi:uncharacterized membrane protein